MKVLFLSRWYPYPPDNGSKVRISNLLRALCERNDVTLLSFAEPRHPMAGGNGPGPLPLEIRVCLYRDFDPYSHRALFGYLSGTPRYLTDTYSIEMDALIRSETRRGGYDLVVASQLSMASYHRCFSTVPAVFDEVELGLFRPDDDTHQPLTWSAWRRKLTWEKHRRYVASVVEKFRFCTVVSQRERELLAEVAPRYRPVHVVPNCIDVGGCDRPAADRAPGSLIFVGSFFYWPNYDAMDWFLREIYPPIRAEVPGVRLTITGDPGRRPPLNGPGVVQTGNVADVHTLVASSVVSIVPIRKGAGTRLKILESIASRTPVVTTSKGVEGLELRGGEHVLIADTPGEFAQAVVRLLREPEYARIIAENAFRFVRSRYDRGVVLPEFTRLVHAAAAS